MVARPSLTSTSYAILGLLSLRSWTTYELAQQMKRALGQFWPRAESKLYEEPKKLVEHGLATATVEHVGKRPRTLYAITPVGAEALRAWMSEPSAGPVIEFEGLIRVFFAEHGTKGDALEAIAAARRWVEERYEDTAGISAAYLAGAGSYPERLPWNILCGRFLHEVMEAVERWADWAGATVEEWPEDLRKAVPDLGALRLMAAASEQRLSAGP